MCMNICVYICMYIHIYIYIHSIYIYIHSLHMKLCYFAIIKKIRIVTQSEQKNSDCDENFDETMSLCYYQKKLINPLSNRLLVVFLFFGSHIDLGFKVES